MEEIGNHYSSAETSDHEYNMEELLGTADDCVKFFATIFLAGVLGILSSEKAPVW